MHPRKKQSLQKAISLTVGMIVLVALLPWVARYNHVDKLFKDKGLEAAVRENLERPEGAIARTELLQITHLDASGRNISRLDGIEHLRRLVSLNLEDNSIQDLSPLQDLSQLTELNVRRVAVTNIPVLAGLMGLYENDSLPGALTGGVRINEAMGSNGTVLADEDGDYEDWIELYNAGSRTVDLSGWGLSDRYNNPFKWTFLAGTLIGPGHYLIVWASGKDRRGGELHTNFRLSRRGEEVVLTDADGTRVDYLPPLKMPRDMSVGRTPEGGSTWYYFDDPNPRAANTTTAYTEILDPVQFSHAGGFYTDEFYLTLSHPDPDVTIVYTLDGSVPDINNLDGTTYMYKNSYPENPGDPLGDTLYQSYQSHIYCRPIRIYDRSDEPDKLTQISSTFHAKPYYLPSLPVRKGTILRAIAFKPGALPYRPQTNSFFVFPEGNPYHLPVISIAIQENHLFDYYDGIYTAGVFMDNWRLNNPDKEVGSLHGNWRRRGMEWEYPAHVEFIEKGTLHPVLSQGVGFRIHGGGGRRQMLKSSRLYARYKYDERNIMHHGFFEDGYSLNKNLQSDQFKRILLRNGGNHLDYTGDIVSHRIMEPVFDGVQRGRNAIQFVNGEFWGLIQLKDRLDHYHLANNHNLDPDNIIILNGVFGEGRRSHIDVGYPEDLLLYQDMYHFVVDHDMSVDENFDQVKTMLDLVSYIDYNAMFIYLVNEDWYGYRHFRFWRVREPTGQGHGDGKWRFMVWDFEHTAHREPSIDYLSNAIHPKADGEIRPFEDPQRTVFLRNLLENQEFRNLFINRFADHINTTFDPERIEDIVWDNYRKIEPYNNKNRLRWRFLPTDLRRAHVFVNFFKARPTHVRQHIREHFNLDSDIQITLDVSSSSKGHVRINTIQIKDDTPGIQGTPYPWNGVYFSNIPIELEAIPEPGHDFTGWVVEEKQTFENVNNSDLTIYSTDPIIAISASEDLYVRALFEPCKAHVSF